MKVTINGSEANGLTLEQARSDADRVFAQNPDAVKFEDRTFENGSVYLTVYGKTKIIHQIKFQK